MEGSWCSLRNNNAFLEPEYIFLQLDILSLAPRPDRPTCGSGEALLSELEDSSYGVDGKLAIKT